MSPQPGAPDPGSPRPRVLVVEDYDDAAESVCTLLRLWGFEAVRCRTAAEGFAALAAGRPHAALLDVHLPDGDGLDLARALLAGDPPPLVIVISGSATEQDRLRAIAAGVQHFLAKPSDPQALRRLLDAHCRGTGPAHAAH